MIVSHTPLAVLFTDAEMEVSVVTQQLTDFATINKVIMKVTQLHCPPTAYICITETENVTYEMCIG